MTEKPINRRVLSQEQERVQKLYLEVTKKYSNKKHDELLAEYNKKMHKMKLDSLEIVKKNCEDYKWFEENANLSYNEKTGHTTVENIPTELQEEGKARMKELALCTKLNCFEQNELLEKIKEINKTIIQNYTQCLQKCGVNITDTKSDNEIKECFEMCITNMDEDNFKKFDFVDKQIEDITRRI